MRFSFLLIVFSVALAPSAHSQIITNGNFESFTAGVPNGWTFLQEPAGGPSSIQSSSQLSPFTNAFPSSANSIVLVDPSALSNSRPVVFQTFADQLGVFDFNFDFLVPPSSDTGSFWEVSLTNTQLGPTFSGQQAARFIIDTPSGNFRAIGQTLFDTPISAGVWYNVQAHVDVPANQFVVSITPFAGGLRLRECWGLQMSSAAAEIPRSASCGSKILAAQARTLICTWITSRCLLPPCQNHPRSLYWVWASWGFWRSRGDGEGGPQMPCRDGTSDTE